MYLPTESGRTVLDCFSFSVKCSLISSQTFSSWTGSPASSALLGPEGVKGGGGAGVVDAYDWQSQSVSIFPVIVLKVAFRGTLRFQGASKSRIWLGDITFLSFFSFFFKL